MLPGRPVPTFTAPMLVALAALRHRAALDRAGRPLPVPRRRDPDLGHLCAGLQSGARAFRACPRSGTAPSSARRLCVRSCAVQHRGQSVALPRRRHAARRLPVAPSSRSSSRTGAASTTRCMTIAFGQVFWFIAIKAHGITGGEDGLLKIARLPAELGVADDRSQGQCRSVLLRARCLRDRVAAAVAPRPFAVRSRTQGHQAERDARPLRRLRRVALQGRRARHLGRPLGPCRRPVRHGADLRLPRRHEPALLGLCRDDDAGRRRSRLVLGSGDRRSGVLPRPRRDRRAHHRLDAVVRPVCSSVLVLFKPEGIAGLFHGRQTSRAPKRAPQRAGVPQPQPR